MVTVLYILSGFFFFFKQKTAYEMRISDWSSDVCSSDLIDDVDGAILPDRGRVVEEIEPKACGAVDRLVGQDRREAGKQMPVRDIGTRQIPCLPIFALPGDSRALCRSEERRGGKECVSTSRFRWSPCS